MRRHVVRDLEVHAVEVAALDEVEDALRTAVSASANGQGKGLEIRRRPSKLEIRLADPALAARDLAQAISGVREGLERTGRGHVVRDVFRVTAGVRDEHLYPDLPSLLRIDSDPDTPPDPGAAAPVVVAIVDSGIMVDHEDLRSRLWTRVVGGAPIHGARCIDGTVDDDITDQDGHGTMVAGAVVAAAGHAPLELMAAKFFDGATLPAAANAAAAIDFAVRHEAQLINLSWDVGLGSLALEQAIRRACAAGALVVIAAGNNGADNDRFRSIPAHYAKDCAAAITVMATDRYDQKASFSNYGMNTVDLAAPGGAIVSTRSFLVGGNEARKYRTSKGTSVAAAYVTGAAALLKSRKPQLTAAQLKQCLMASADRLPGLKCRADGGRLNLGRALSTCW